jgi:hypothetical protein
MRATTIVVEPNSRARMKVSFAGSFKYTRWMFVVAVPGDAIGRMGGA